MIRQRLVDQYRQGHRKIDCVGREGGGGKRGRGAAWSTATASYAESTDSNDELEFVFLFGVRVSFYLFITTLRVLPEEQQKLVFPGDRMKPEPTSCPS